jgi:hypothetical protein
MVKKIISLALVLTLVSLFAVASADAGSKARHRWQGAAIALGALAIGGLVAHQIYANTLPPPQPDPYYYRPQTEYVPGHWEKVHEWVPGRWERVWVPGYYDRYGRWVAGHYVERQTPGYYVERKTWVEGYYRQY